jgi:hypothetical protein
MECKTVRYQVIGGPRDGDYVEFEFGRVFSQISLEDKDGINQTYDRRTVWVTDRDEYRTWRVYYVSRQVDAIEFERRAQEIEDASRKAVS